VDQGETVLPGTLDTLGRVVKTGWSFVLFGMASWTLSWVILPRARRKARRKGLSEDEQALECRRLVSRGFRWFLRLLDRWRLIEWEPDRYRLELPAGPFIMVANHPALLDVAILGGLLDRLYYVVKEPLLRSALIGPLLRHCNHVSAGNGGTATGISVMRAIVRRLDAGYPVLIFPEGTRSPAYGMRTFHAGACELACHAGVPIVPLFIRCDPPTLTKGAPWYRVPPRRASLTVTQLPVVDTSLWQGKAATLNTHLSDLYRQHLDAHQASVPEEDDLPVSPLPHGSRGQGHGAPTEAGSVRG
jgi:1-acyl-sn-glycerol-3-phosphate acyltransferase